MFVHAIASRSPIVVSVKMLPVARNVRRYRKANGMTQTQLAEAIGGEWDQSRVSSIERGHWKNPSYERLVELASALRVTVAALTTDDDQPPAEQLPLDAPVVPVNHVLSDLYRLGETRPDLQRAIRKLEALRDVDAERYRQTLVILLRHVLSGIDTARDILGPEDTGN